MHRQSLDGTWTVQNASNRQSYPATVPGNIHLDLLAAGVIPDPLVHDNEMHVRWVAETDWIYSRTFEPDEALLAHERLFLECDGLDTLAAIRLNGEEIGRTDNMFRRYEFEVTGKVHPGINRLEIEFQSPVKGALQKVMEGDLILAPPESIPGSPYIRKAMYQWGWDWAPKIPTSGIWRPIRLVGRSIARIQDIHVTREHSPDRVNVGVRVITERYSGKRLYFNVKLTAPDGESMEESVSIGSENTEARLEFVVENPQLWWPNGYGSQPLYELQVELAGEPHAGDEASVQDSRDMRIGLRTLELRQQEDQWGRSFMFVVNEVPIFAKGADWIPADQFPTRIQPEDYRDLIASAAYANMNMLRVWGGGFYETDDFYNLCDEYGILIWQDFMFACAHYPADPDTRENIRQEANDNVRRIRHHPCLALWCGNNEMDWFLARGWTEHGDEDRKREYLELFYGLLPGVVSTEDPDTPYWPSSPASGVPFKDPNGENEGDGHYWEVWHGRSPFTAYRQHFFRFMSEFGYQSLPSMNTVKTFADPKDWNISSYIMESHQKSYVGNKQILYDMVENLRLPGDFPMLVYASQILQAEAIRYGVEHWRRNRNGNRCMGTLYWQLNDCWPVASWSGIEYNHHWKALHYFARRAYSPILLSAEEQGLSVNLHVTNDLLEPFRGEVCWSLERLDGTQIQDGKEPVEVPGASSLCIAKLEFSQLLANTDIQHNTVLVYELYQGSHRLSLGMTPFIPSKHLELGNPEIQVGVDEGPDGIWIRLTAKNTARFVMLEVEDADLRFSDNFFDLPAGRTVKIKVIEPGCLSAAEIREKVKTVSLVDSFSSRK